MTSNHFLSSVDRMFITQYVILCRLAGVYGPYEDMIVNRSLAFLQSKLSMLFVCYDKDIRVDFVHIRNVIQAHINVDFPY